MVGLIVSGRPDVVCLQEVPVWATAELEKWSGIRSVTAVAMRALGGPLARRLTDLDPDRIRSGLAGQANAVLLGADVSLRDVASLTLNPRSFRRREARRLALPAGTARHWARNRRVGQFVRVEVCGRTLVVVNLHLTASADSRPAEAELERALGFADGFALPGEPVLVCGDLNLTPASSTALRALPRAGFSSPAAGIDQILTRGLTIAREPLSWPEDRRRLAGRLLSDHAPVEAEMMYP